MPELPLSSFNDEHTSNYDNRGYNRGDSGNEAGRVVWLGVDRSGAGGD